MKTARASRRCVRGVVSSVLLCLGSSLPISSTTLVYVIDKDWVVAVADSLTWNRHGPAKTGFMKLHRFGPAGLLGHSGALRYCDPEHEPTIEISALIDWLGGPTTLRQNVAAKIEAMHCAGLRTLEWNAQMSAADNAMQLLKVLEVCGAQCPGDSEPVVLDVFAFEGDTVAAETFEYYPPNQALGGDPRTPKGDRFARHKIKLEEERDGAFPVILSQGFDQYAYRVAKGVDKALIGQGNVDARLKAAQAGTGRKRADLLASVKQYRNLILRPGNFQCRQDLPDCGVPQQPRWLRESLAVDLARGDARKAIAYACTLLKVQVSMMQFPGNHVGRALNVWSVDEENVNWGPMLTGTCGALRGLRLSRNGSGPAVAAEIVWTEYGSRCEDFDPEPIAWLPEAADAQETD